MNQNYELPHDIDAEKELLAALLVKNGKIVPEVAVIVSTDDFYRPEHRIIYRVILELYAQGTPPNILSVFQALSKTGEIEKIERKYLLSIASMTVTNAYAVAHAKIVKEKSDLRRLMNTAESLFHEAQQGFSSPAEIIAEHQVVLEEISRTTMPTNKTDFNEYLTGAVQRDIDEMKSYADRKTGFENLDENQYFTPGLYVIGATPAAGKTTFCWQLLEQLARKGETCIYCSYEMSRLELFSKTFARELFKRNKETKLTGAQIRRGGASRALYEVFITQIANVYRNRAIGHCLQKHGAYVITNVRWGDERSYTTKELPEKFAFLGAPKNSIVSVGTYGCIRGKENRHFFREGLEAMLDELTPEVVLVYGRMPKSVFSDEIMSKTNFVCYPDWISQVRKKVG